MPCYAVWHDASRTEHVRMRYSNANLMLNRKTASDAFYTTLWNILDYPALCFPATSVDADEDLHALPNREFYNHEDQAIHNLCKVFTRVYCFSILLAVQMATNFSEMPPLGCN